MPPIDPRTDADLVAAANAGDASAFDALYRRHRDFAARVARRHVPDDAAAADVVQDVFLGLLGKFPGFRLTARMTTYLYPVVRRAALSGRRRPGVRLRLTGDAADGALASARSAEPSPDADDGLDDLRAVVAGLPAAQREAVLLRFADDLSIDEIAAATGVPAGTVKSRLHHAVARLRGDPRVRRYFGQAP